MNINTKFLSWKVVNELSKTMDCDQIADYVIANYKNVNIQQYGNIMLFSVNNAAMIKNMKHTEETKQMSYAQLSRLLRREMNCTSCYINDELVE